MDDDGTPQLSDYNRSKFIDHRGFTSTFGGSSRYMAPELFGDANFHEDEFSSPEIPPDLTKQTDVYSFSMLALEVSNLLRT
jgi:serine/threonine protein kinase